MEFCCSSQSGEHRGWIRELRENPFLEIGGSLTCGHTPLILAIRRASYYLIAGAWALLADKAREVMLLREQLARMSFPELMKGLMLSLLRYSKGDLVTSSAVWKR